MIPAGRSGTLVAKVHTRPTQNGTLSKSISVLTDAADARALRLTLKFRVASAIEVYPRPQVYLGTTEGEPKTSSLLLRRTDGEPLTIEAAEFEDPTLTLAVREAGTEDEELIKGIPPRAGDVWLDVSTTAAMVESRTVRAWVHTNHPDLPEFEIPVTVRVRPVIEARPAEMSYVIPRRGAPRRINMFRVHHHGGQEFRVTSLEPADPSLISASLATKGSQRTHVVHVTLDERVGTDGQAKSISTSLLVRTDHPDKPKIRIPVEITVHERTEPLQARPPSPMPTGTPTYQ